MRLYLRSLAAVTLLVLASIAQAQQTIRPGQVTTLPMGQMEQSQVAPTQEIARPGQIATSAVGQIGQRQSAAAIDTGRGGVSFEGDRHTALRLLDRGDVVVDRDRAAQQRVRRAAGDALFGIDYDVRHVAHDPLHA